MKRFIISVVAVVIATIIIAVQVEEAKLAILSFVSNNRALIGVCVAILIAGLALVIGTLNCQGKARSDLTKP